MFVYGGILVVMMLVRRQGLLGGRPYSLRLTRFDGRPGVYLRGRQVSPGGKTWRCLRSRV